MSTCGTNKGYAAHLRDNEATCTPCKAAHNQYQAANAAAHRAHRGRRAPRITEALVVQLWETATPSAIAELDRQLTPAVVDRIIRQRDEETNRGT
jgi:hypothetical protein